MGNTEVEMWVAKDQPWRSFSLFRQGVRRVPAKCAGDPAELCTLSTPPAKHPRKSVAKPAPPVAVVPDPFPDHMRVAREALGWSQAKLARNAGIDKRSVGRYEAGLVAPSIQAAAKLAVTLGKSLDVLAGIGPSTSDPQTSALLAKLQLLPPDRRVLVLALVKVLGEK